LGSSCQSDIGGSETGGRDFGDIDPADWTPSKLEKGSEQENHDDSDITGWGNSGALLWGIEADVKADIEHAGTLSDGCPEERLTTTEGVRNEEKEDGAGDHFDNSIDTGSEETSFSS
jgi:hypothetical protein